MANKTMKKSDIRGSQNVRKNGSSSRAKRTAYVSGSVAPSYDVVRELNTVSVESPLIGVRRKHTSHHMTFPYVVFLSAILGLSSFALFQLIHMRSEMTTTIASISSLESELNSLKMTNNEEYNRIQSSVDLDEIRRIATEELGMVYAREGQVITYSGEGNDYVKQSSSLHE